MNVVSSWLLRIIAIQERRPHQFVVCFLIVAFVGIVRTLFEWIIGHQPLVFLNQSILISVSYYVMVLFLYTAPLALLVKQSWRTSMNVVLAAVFCGILPPIIDGVLSGAGTFRYQYVLDFPAGWPWTLHSPDKGLPIGETVVLWLTVALTSFYVWRKTANAYRGIAAAMLAYAVVVLHGGALPTLVEGLYPGSGWGGKGAPITYAQLAVVLILYLLFRPAVATGLLKRWHHTLPFILVCLIGGAMEGPPDSVLVWSVALVQLAFLVALAQNDYFDRDEDARQGRAPYVDREDVAVLNIVFLLLVFTLILNSSAIGYILLIIFLVSVLYSYPMYRGKRFFPANLKSEGVWGASSFLIGVASSAGSGAPVDPTTLSFTASTEASHNAADIFDAPTLVALLLVFSGWSMVAALKDFKDVRADARSGIQTLYTLAVRRGWGLHRVHRILSITVALSMLLPFPLLAWAQDWPYYTAAAGLPFAVGLLLATNRAPSRAGFQSILATINLCLFALLAAVWLFR